MLGYCNYPTLQKEEEKKDEPKKEEEKKEEPKKEEEKKEEPKKEEDKPKSKKSQKSNKSKKVRTFWMSFVTMSPECLPNLQ